VSNRALSLPQDFLDFIALLNEHHVEFVLVGGYALGVHGYVRATGDIDFLYRLTDANVARLCTSLTEFGAPPHLINRDALLDPDVVTYFGMPPLRIDLLSSISGVESDVVFDGAIDASVAGQRLRVIGRLELESNKRASGHEQDLQDLRALARTQRQRRSNISPRFREKPSDA